jgi:parallel beta-helix repeat protein
MLRLKIESLLPKIIHVDDDNVTGPWNGTEESPYQNITSGLEHASDNDTVFVQTGMYCEHVVVNKSILLIGGGSSTTIIDGEGTGSVIYVSSDDVTIAGFTVQNSGRLINGTVPDAGISASHVSDLNVSGNLLTDNYVGVFVRPSRYTWFTNNVIAHNHIGIDVNNQSTHNVISGNSLKENNVSIHVYYADFNTFFENNLTNSPVGIIIRYSYNNAFNENEIRNGLNGMILNDADFNNISKNAISELEYGIQLKAYADHNFICENSITNCSYAGIDLDEYVCYNSLSNNTIGSSEVGMDISNWSVNNTISRNSLTANLVSMHFWYANLNRIFENNITSNYAGAVILHSQSNRFYHNTFLNNTKHANISKDYTNFWDNGYPSGGNYWSNYTGVDSDHDGIGDTEHSVDSNNTDHFPLMGIFFDCNTTSEHHVQAVCNSSMSDFQFNGTAISFNVSGESGTPGFCRICIPTSLMNSTFAVLVNNTVVDYHILSCSNETHNYLYFTYNHSIQQVIIIPEFLSHLIPPLFIVATLPAAIIYSKRQANHGKPAAQRRTR